MFLQEINNTYLLLHVRLACEKLFLRTLVLFVFILNIKSKCIHKGFNHKILILFQISGEKYEETCIARMFLQYIQNASSACLVCYGLRIILFLDKRKPFPILQDEFEILMILRSILPGKFILWGNTNEPHNYKKIYIYTNVDACNLEYSTKDIYSEI